MLTLIGFLFSLLLLRYIYLSRTILDYQPTGFNQKLLKKCQIISQRFFFFTPYLFHGLLQAYRAATAKDHDPGLRWVREYVDFGNDFGYFALDWGCYDGKVREEEAQSTSGRPLVVVLSGLTASRMESYISQFFGKFCSIKSDWRIVLYNDRLFNNRIYMDPNRSILPANGYFHHNEDFRRVLEYLANKHKNSPIYAIGHSFGSNTLARYLGQCGSLGKDPLIQAGVLICCPFDFQVGSRHLSDSISDNYILKHRQRIIGEKLTQYFPLPKHINFDYQEVKSAKKSYELDEVFTKKVFGAETVDLHYMSVNSINYLEFIKVPTLLLGSFDDPVPVYPQRAILRNPHLISLMTKVGGHVSWFEGFWKPTRWYYKPVIEYLDAVHSLLK